MSLLWLSACNTSNKPGTSQPIPNIPNIDISFTSNSKTTNFTIGNDGPEDSSMNWSITVSENKKDGQTRSGNWFTVSKEGDNLAGKKTETITLTLLDNLLSGNYTAKITISASGETKSFIVSANVSSSTSKAVPVIPDNNINLANNTPSTSFTIGNNGPNDSNMNWEVTASKNTLNDQPTTAWLDITPNKGNLAGNKTQEITLAKKNNLTAGNYSSEITIKYLDKTASFSVRATVGSSASNVQIRYNSTSESFEILNPSNQDLAWEIEVKNSNNPTAGDWLNIIPVKGTAKGQNSTDFNLQPANIISLKVKEGLSEGLYHSILNFKFTDINKTVGFNVNKEVRYPKPEIPSTPVELADSFTFKIANKGDELTQFDWNIELSDITKDGKAISAWFSVDPARGNVKGGQSQDVTLTTNEGLKPGSYSALLTVTPSVGNKVSFKVTNTIRVASEDERFIPFKPLSLPQSGSATFSISNTGPANSALEWTIATQDNTRDGQKIDEWLNITPINAVTKGGESTPITLTLKPDKTTQAGLYRSVLCVDYKVGKQCFAITAQLGSSQTSGDFELSYDNVNYPIPKVTDNITIKGVPVFITRQGNFSDPVTLKMVSAPKNVTVTVFNPNPLSASNNYSVLTLTIGAGAPAGDHKIVVSGTGGGKTKTVEIPITITGTTIPADFSLSLNPTSLSINTGSSSTSKVIVNSVGGFNSEVSFSVGSKPTGVNVSFSPTSHKSESTVTISVTNNAVPGLYALRITGKGGGKEDSINLSLKIEASDPENASITGNLKTENRIAEFSVPTLTTTSVGTSSLQVTPVRESQKFVSNQLLVQYRNDDLAGLSTQAAQERYELRAQAVQEAFGLQTLQVGGQEMPDLLLASVDSDEQLLDLAQQLASNENVAYVEPNYIISGPQSLPNDTKLREQWHLPATGLPVAWEVRTTSTKTIAVLDTGIDTTHKDLQGIFHQGRDFCGGKQNGACTEDTNPTPEFNGDIHGTHVTGIIAALGNNAQGVTGVLQSGKRIVPVKVFFNGNFTTVNALARALRWAAGISITNAPNNLNPANIINMSLGSETNSSTLKDAVTAVNSKGVLIIAAAGNYGQNTLLYPARYTEVMAVGSINSKFQRSCFSHFGSGLDIVAPGGDYDISKVVGDVSCPSNTTSEAVSSTTPSNNYGLLFGTSQAAPVVTGVAALVWSQNPNFTVTQVRNRLKSTAYKTSTMPSDKYGAGILRADRALGIPGPSDNVVVTAKGAATGDSDNDTVKLNLQGTSNNFLLEGLKGDKYKVTANANNKLLGSIDVQLGVSQKKNGIVVLLHVP